LKGDEYMTYSEILKKVREECDMTQAEFAMYFNVPKRTYQDWEYGKSKVPEYLLRLMLYKLKMEGKTEDLTELITDNSEGS